MTEFPAPPRLPLGAERAGEAGMTELPAAPRLPLGAARRTDAFPVEERLARRADGGAAGVERIAPLAGPRPAPDMDRDGASSTAEGRSLGVGCLVGAEGPLSVITEAGAEGNCLRGATGLLTGRVRGIGMAWSTSVGVEAGVRSGCWEGSGAFWLARGCDCPWEVTETVGVGMGIRFAGGSIMVISSSSRSFRFALAIGSFAAAVGSVVGSRLGTGRGLLGPFGLKALVLVFNILLALSQGVEDM